MKILFINQTLGLGGAETWNRDLLAWLNRTNSVTAYTTFPRFKSVLESVGVTTLLIPLVIDLIGDWKGLIKGLLLLPFGLIYYSWLVWRNRHSDVILMTGFIEKVLVTPIAALLNIPVIWIEFAPLSPVLDKFMGLPKFLYSLVKNLPRATVVPSRHTLKHLQPVRPHLIPLGITLHKSYSVSTVPHLVCCVSRLEPGKGQDLLLAAWPQVISAVPDARLEIVGDGGARQTLEREVVRQGLGKSVRFTGFVSDVFPHICRGQVFVMPSVWPLEGFGLAAVEAMSQKKPVIAFATGPLPEIVDNKTGIIVPAGDTAKLSAAIVYLLKRPKICLAKGRAGFAKYRRNFTLDISGPKFLNLMASL